MKVLLKSGLCLALGWAATRAGAQDSMPSGVRPISLRAPVPLTALDGSRPAPLVRGQIPDERPLPSGPSLSAEGIGPPPRPMPPATGGALPLPGNSQSFTAPAPQVIGPMPAPLPGPLPGAPAPPLGSNSLWGTTLPPGAADVCGDCAGGICGTTGPCGGACGFGACDPCCSNRCNGGLFWVSAEYLLWFTRTQSVTPLVTASPVGTPLAQSGVLGFPTTQTLFDHVNNNPVSGGRISAGFWFPNCNNWGMDASYFFLGRQSSTQTFSGDQVSRPAIDATTGAAIAELVSFPGIVNGTATVHTDSQLWGFDANLRKRVCCGCNYWLDVLAGYRHLELDESISITENLNVLNAAGGVAGNIQVFDSFRTANTFNGAQMGLQGQWYFARRFFLGGTFKLAMGNVNQVVDISGSTTYTGFTGAGAINGTRPAGTFALPTNIGHFSQNRFGVLPEAGVRVGMDITQHLQAFVGYDFLFLSTVVRPNDQIDPVLNLSQIPSPTVAGVPPLVGPARPTVLFRTTDFWAQGIDFGLRYHW